MTMINHGETSKIIVGPPSRFAILALKIFGNKSIISFQACFLIETFKKYFKIKCVKLSIYFRSSSWGSAKIYIYLFYSIKSSQIHRIQVFSRTKDIRLLTNPTKYKISNFFPEFGENPILKLHFNLSIAL